MMAELVLPRAGSAAISLLMLALLAATVAGPGARPRSPAPESVPEPAPAAKVELVPLSATMLTLPPPPPSSEPSVEPSVEPEPAAVAALPETAPPPATVDVRVLEPVPSLPVAEAAEPEPTGLDDRADDAAPMVEVEPEAAPVDPMPVAEPSLSPEPVPEAKAAVEPPHAVDTAPATPTTPPMPVKPTAVDRREGRALLRLLEVGDGPSIEIAWPDDAAARDALASVLLRCHGMEPAILTSGGQVLTRDSVPGRAMPLDQDRLSGFIRDPQGALSRTERALQEELRRRHGGPAGHFVRLFTRETDAALLGSLARMTAGSYRDIGRITATYRQDGVDVAIVDVRIDGRPIAGVLVLPTSRACASTG